MPKTLVMLFMLVGVSTTSAQSFVALSGKTPQAVDALLGPPVSTTGPDTLAATKIRSSRSYEVVDGVIGVAFCNGTSYAMAFTLTSEEMVLAAVLTRAGFGATLGAPSAESDAELIVWEQVAGFARITVHKRGDGWGGVTASTSAQGCRP